MAPLAWRIASRGEAGGDGPARRVPGWEWGDCGMSRVVGTLVFFSGRRASGLLLGSLLGADLGRPGLEPVRPRTGLPCRAIRVLASPRVTPAALFVWAAASATVTAGLRTCLPLYFFWWLSSTCWAHTFATVTRVGQSLQSISLLPLGVLGRLLHGNEAGKKAVTWKYTRVLSFLGNEFLLYPLTIFLSGSVESS